jgi:hypothetical protein
MACQVPEDICLMRLADDREWLAMAHVCSPSGWAPAAKVGRAFAAIHEPVPHIERLSATAAELMRAMVYRGPYLRFVWGISSDNRLNHHPDSLQPVAPFVPGESKLYVRVERQVTWGLPQLSAAVFTIHVSHFDVEQVRRDPHQRQQLHAALRSMSSQSLSYKGLGDSIDAIIRWLR